MIMDKGVLIMLLQFRDTYRKLFRLYLNGNFLIALSLHYPLLKKNATVSSTIIGKRPT